MGDKIKHAPGMFCWTELMTSDAAAAKVFYAPLFGWELHDDPIPGGGTYTMIRLDGGDVGGLYEIGEEMKAAGVPTHWLPYVTVASAAEAAEKARTLGGTVRQEAFDVMDVGSMAVVSDGAYGVPEGLICGFPCRIADGRWETVRDLELDAFAEARFRASVAELEEEKSIVADLL